MDQKIIPVSNSDYLDSGGRPPIIAIGPSPTSLWIVSNDDANTKMDPTNFTVLLYDWYVSINSCILKSALITMPPNITPNNNKIQLNVGGTITSIYTIPVGFYNPTDMCNILTSTILNGFASEIVPILDNIAISFNYNTFKFTMANNSGNNMDFINTCSFIKFGNNCCAFAGTNIAPISLIVVSNRASLIYSRYFSIHSVQLVNNGFTPKSTLSNGVSGWDLIGVVDSSKLYMSNDFSTSGSFNGILRECQIENAPAITFTRMKYIRTNQTIDIRAYDEYGFSLGSSYDDSTTPFTLIFQLAF